MQSTCVALMEPIRRTKVKVRVGKVKNRKAAGEMIKSGGKKVLDWIWRLCNMTFESGLVPEDWKSPVIISLHKGKGERGQNAAMV